MPDTVAHFDSAIEVHAGRRWRICAVIVAFYPDDGFCARALKVARQVSAVVVIDNGSTPSVKSRFAEVASPLVHVAVLENATNVGVATALNQGIEWAEAHAFTHALLFDQDTEPVDNMAMSIERFAEEYPNIERVAVIGVNFLDTRTRKPAFPSSSNAGPLQEAVAVITSGSVICLRIAAMLGPFRDDFFIDCVDEEFCLRARSHGYKVLLIRQPLMIHGLGTPIIHRLPWRTIGTSNHSALRRYYMMRNYILLARQYAADEPGWFFRTLYVRIKSLLLMLLFDDDRIAKVWSVWRGIVDGLAGRTGPAPASHSATDAVRS